MNITVDFSTNIKQRRMWELMRRPDIEVIGFGGAKGGGKSHGGRNAVAIRALTYPGTTHLIVRKTLDELDSNHVRKLKKEWPEHVYDYRDQKHTFEFKNKSVIDLRYLDTEDDLERRQGSEYDTILMDEAQMWTKIFFQTLRSCLRHANASACGSKAGEIVPKMLLTWNWGNVGHQWLKRMFWRKWMRPGLEKDPEALADEWGSEAHWDIGEKPSQFAFVQAFWSDNPYLDAGYKDRLLALPEHLRKAFMDGDPDIFEGMFFPEFGPHLRELPFFIEPHLCNLYGSLDYGDGDGEGASKTSFGLWHIDERGKPHRLFTYYQGRGDAETHARNIVGQIKSFFWTSGTMPKKVLADPSMFIKRKMDVSNSFSVADIFEQYGLTLTPANNQRVNGWRIMRTAFCLDAAGQPNSFYWDGLNDEYETYIPSLVYHKTNKSDVLKGGDDHVGDEARYFFVHAMNLKGEGANSKNGNQSYESMIKLSRAHAVAVGDSETGWV
jgi:hypothetical protein